MSPSESFLHNAKDSEGFSLLEIAVVLAVLSLLSSIAIPNILKIGKDSNLSEAQALLNSAAADCLQSKRNGKSLSNTPPDENIISDTKLENINYKIKQSSANCSNFQIEPFKNGNSLASKDPFYYTLGFRFQGDRLVKIATDEAVDGRQSCKRWAGLNCKFDPEMEKKWNDYYEHMANLSTLKTACISAANKKLAGPPLYTGMYETWVPTADSACKDDPPNIPSTNCEPQSCNQKAFAKDGKPVEGEDALNAALCSDWLDEVRENKINTTYPPFIADKDPMGKCLGNPDFWFVDGIDQVTEQDFKNKLCENWVKGHEEKQRTNKENPLTEEACGDKEYWFYKGEDQGSKANVLNKECEAEIEDLRVSGWNGIWSTEGPIACSKKTYICNYRLMEESEYYQTCGKNPPEKCKEPLGYFDQDCADYETNEYKILVCNPRPAMTMNYKDYGYPDPYPCGGVGRGAPTSKGWDKTEVCKDWAIKCDLYK